MDNGKTQRDDSRPDCQLPRAIGDVGPCVAHLEGCTVWSLPPSGKVIQAKGWRRVRCFILDFCRRILGLSEPLG